MDADLRVRRRAARPSGRAGSAAAPPCARCRCPRGTSAPRRSRCGWPPGACRSPRTCGCPSSAMRPPASAARATRCSRGARRGSRCRSARAATCAGSCRSSRSRGRSALNGKVRERVRAVDDRLDAAAPRLVADLLHREDLPGEVRDVAEVQHLRRRRDRGEQPVGEIVHRLRRHRERDLRQLDAVAPDALLPRVEHPAVVLVGRHDLVAGLEVDAELRDLQRLAGVARDRDLLGVAAERRRPAAGGRSRCSARGSATCGTRAPGWRCRGSASAPRGRRAGSGSSRRCSG